MLLINVHSLIYNQIDCFAFFFETFIIAAVSLCSVFKARQYRLPKQILDLLNSKNLTKQKQV